MRKNLIFQSAFTDFKMTAYALPHSLDSEEATSLAQRLRAMEDDMVIDASGVKRVGALCVQVLIAARKTCATTGKGLHIEAPSEEFLEGLTRLGCIPAVIGIEEVRHG